MLVFHFTKQLTFPVIAVFLTVVGCYDSPTASATLDRPNVRVFCGCFIRTADRESEERKPGDVENGGEDRSIYEFFPSAVVT